MMSTRRSLFVSSVLLSALVLFGAEAAFAQAADPTAFAAAARAHDTIRLTWNSANTNTEKFSVRYQQKAPATSGSTAATDFSTTLNTMRMDVAKTTSTAYSVTIDDLKPGMPYIFGLTALGSGDEADADEVFADTTTDGPDAPDDVMGLTLTAGDAMIMAMWDMTTDNGSPITGYGVHYREKGKTTWMSSRDGTTGMDTSTKWTISNLTNDMTYEVRVQACSYTMCGDWTDEEEATPMMGAAMPTPALPLFGAFALGAGLLAAGRSRLRRRQLRAGRTQHQLGR